MNDKDAICSKIYDQGSRGTESEEPEMEQSRSSQGRQPFPAAGCANRLCESLLH